MQAAKKGLRAGSRGRLSKYLEDPRHFDRLNSPKKWRLDVALPGESKVRAGSVKRSIAFYLARFAVRFATKRMVNRRREGDGGS